MPQFTKFPDGTKGVDITGQTFGNFTAIKYAGKNKRGVSMFEFLCTCGNIKTIEGSYVTTGKYKTCGCSLQGNNLNIIGNTFGNLTVIEFAGKNKDGNSLYKFKCSCGKFKVLLGSRVTNGYTLSCGCLSKGPKINIEGKKYNILTAVKFNGKDKRGNALYEFKCDCGKTKTIRASKVIAGEIKSCGCLIGKGRIGNRYDAEARSHIGEVHHRLTVIDIERDDKESGYKMICKCSCGSGKIVKCTYTKLRRGEFKSCGCHKNEMSSITGSTIGRHNGNSAGRMCWEVDGMWLRSGLEVLMVLGFKQKGIKFEYEPKTFKLGDGIRYTPDFYLPESETWIEVKGFMKGKDNEKIERFRKLGNRISVYMLSDIEQFSGIKYHKLLKNGMYRRSASSASSSKQTACG